MSRIRTAQMVALAFAASLLVTAPSTAPAGATSTKSFDLGVTSQDRLPDKVPVTKLAGSQGTVTTQASTPDGFILQHPGIRRSDYVYDSDNVYQGSYHCSGSTCTLLAQVKIQLHEYVIGGSSHTWQLTMNMAKYSNPGAITWSYSATYWCGVNISGASDTTCTNGAAPSNATMSTNTVVNKPWGATNSITVFPMVQASTLFSNGVNVTTKFRGYDTLSRSSTTRLNTSSGDGS